MNVSSIYGLRLFGMQAVRTRLALAAATMTLAVYVLRSVQQLVNLDVSNDYLFYLRAANGLAAGKDIYADFKRVCPHAGIGCQGFSGYYIYPPLLGELMRPLTALSTTAGARVWVLAGHLMLVLGALLVYRTVRPMATTATIAAVAAAALLFLPLYENLYFMQVNTFVLFLLAAAAWLFVVQPSGVGAGVALATGAVLRVTPAPIGLVFLRSRRSLRGLVAMGLTAVVLLGVLALLTPATVGYLTSVLPRLVGSTPWIENQSLPGAMARAATLASPNGTATAIIGVATPLLSVAIVIITFARSLGVDGRRGRAVVFATFLAALPIYSSVTEQHHLTAELLVYALLAPFLVAGSRAWWLALVSYPFLWVSHDDAFGWISGLSGQAHDYALAVLLMVPLNLVGMILLWLSCQQVLRSFDRSSPP